MKSLEQVVDAAVADGHTPGLVVSVANRDGVIFDYAYLQ